MQFDVFFSISQTPVDGHMPDEATMLRNWMEQVEAADGLGYQTAWLAESHLSSEVQKRNKHPVIPHWEGEVGLNCDMLQSAHEVFHRTGPARRDGRASASHGGRGIEVGSAVMNILQGGGPIAHAERIAYFAALHGLDEDETRRIHVGFSAGRFDYMNRAHGYVPRDDLERAVPYPFLKGKWFHEATEVFCRLLAGETLQSDDVPHRTITEAECRTDDDWQRIRTAGRAAGRIETGPPNPLPDPTAAGGAGRSIIPTEPDDAQPRDAAGEAEHVVLPKRFEFETLKVIPQDWRRELVQLVAGSHDPRIPVLGNRFLPCQVANLSITPPEVIERTHAFMEDVYHEDGGPWRRAYMPRTVMVFLNEEDGLTPQQRTGAAQAEARKALEAYWNALTGTIDPDKVEHAADNAVIGNAADVAAQMEDRFHPGDRIMLWFDFFNHDSARVVRDMEAFMQKVAPEMPGQEVVA